MDILSAVAVKLPCKTCGEDYEVPLRDVLQSHELLHEGCPVMEETECPMVHQAALFSAEAVQALERDWNRLEQRAQKDGGRLVLRDGSQHERR